MNTHVNTVRGAMPIDDIGVTLTHEHLYKDCTKIYFRQFPQTKDTMSDELISRENRDEIWADKHKILYEYTDNLRLDSVDDIVAELKEFTAAGGSTIFEVTTGDLGRDPLKLREISEKSGVNIIMGGTHYYLPMLEPTLYERVVNGQNGAHVLADMMIKEYFDGVGDTGIKPGVLGEVGLRHPPTDEILARATLIAQKETGAPVIYHYAPFWILDMAEEIGADPTKIVMGHWTMSNRVDEAIARGAWVSFDQFGMDFPGIINDEQRADEVLAMFEKGYDKHLLLSMDICWKVRLKKNGGDGYAGIFHNGFERIMQKGISKQQLLTVMTDNPKRLLR